MNDTNAALAKTPLYDLHVKLGARMVPFAGYSMPVQYTDGILKEHLHTRAAAGLFDVSHMGQLRLHGATAASELEHLVPIDIIDLPLNRQRYGLFTNNNGGILDDLMITRCADYLLLVVNAACKHTDTEHLRAHLSSAVELESLPNHALLALQGPAARDVLIRLAPDANKLKFMHAGALSIAGIPCWVSCSGYTGEDGFEISVADEAAEDLAKRLLAEPEVAAIGLGARDSLRLEAGLCLYGHDIDQDTTPVEASLAWALSKIRRPGGLRAGGYFGAEIIDQQLQQGSARRRVLLRPQGKQPIREGAAIVDRHGVNIGIVTSGGFGPSVAAPVAMGYVKVGGENDDIFAVVRDKLLPMTIQRGPFTPHRYVRGD